MPVNGAADFKFTLWDADLPGGNHIADSVPAITSAVVENGLFTVALDFGADVLIGEARWLQIEVCTAVICTYPADFTAVTPRQKLTASPYALALPGLWTQQDPVCPNLIGGWVGNWITPAAHGATVGGGGRETEPNRVTDRFGTVGGGSGNLAGDDGAEDMPFATVAGGQGNWAKAWNATVAGGASNLALGRRSAIGGGQSNSAFNDGVTIAGGYLNASFSDFATVSGGKNNQAGGEYSAVPGGQDNEAAGSHSLAAGHRAKVGAGDAGTFVWADSTDADFSSTASDQFLIRASGGVGIGTDDPAGYALNVNGHVNATDLLINGVPVGSGSGGISGGGTANYVSKFTGPTAIGDSIIYEEGGNVGIGTTSLAEKLDVAGTVQMTGLKMATGAGDGRVLTSDAAGVGTWNDTVDIAGDVKAGGIIESGSNISRSNKILIDGPTGRIISSAELEVLVNTGTRALSIEPTAGTPNLIGGCPDNSATAGVTGATIGGGGAGFDIVEGPLLNKVTDDYGTVGGGRRNRAGDDAGTTSDKSYATVGGGRSNIASGTAATIAGGSANSAGGIATAIGGGSNNSVFDKYGTIGGGMDNEAGSDDSVATSAQWATVSGGEQNEASGGSATVGGGKINLASGQYSAVPGGSNNTAQGAYSFAAGRKAKASKQGAFVWADSENAEFNCPLSDAFYIRARNGVKVVTNNSGEWDFAAEFRNWGDADGIHAVADVSRGHYSGALVAINLGTSPAITALSGSVGGANAAYLEGDVEITGNVSKPGGSFKIDHPLDPENKYLYHSFVESPDMMNVYNGNVTTDGDGWATVELPPYFGALNKDFRYQLTVIGQFAQAIVGEKISNNRFLIRTDKGNVEVSWQVTGIRQDAWANANRVLVEVAKSDSERGKFLHARAHGMPEEFGLHYEAMQKRLQALGQSRGDK